MATLAEALHQFEAAEANLGKLERLLARMDKRIPKGIAFELDAEYERDQMAYSRLLSALPAIGGAKPTEVPRDLQDIAQNRLDAQEIGEPEAWVTTENWIEEPARQLREYRFRFDNKRRELVRYRISELTTDCARFLAALDSHYDPATDPQHSLHDDDNEEWLQFQASVEEIGALLGSLPKPPRWSDLQRHIHFGQYHDLRDIIGIDWPEVSAGLSTALYHEDEPIPVDAEDLDTLVKGEPSGPVATALNWNRLSPEMFERLIFALVSLETSYENPEWLMHTSAADRGRDVSVARIMQDPLSGTTRSRVIIQCKHRPKHGINIGELSTLREQVSLWNSPRVDVLVVATTGRFTADAVEWVERNNASDTSLKIEMWPDSHLERLLASRPGLIAEFRLRG